MATTENEEVLTAEQRNLEYWNDMALKGTIYHQPEYKPSTPSQNQTGGMNRGSNGLRDEYDNPEDLYEDNPDWFEDADELTEIHMWNPQEEAYQSQTIHVDTVESLLDNGQAGCFDDEYYDLLDPETGLPLNYSDDTNAYEEEHEYATIEEAV